MKKFTTLNRDKVVSILEDFKASSGEYPTTNDIKRLKEIHKHILPSVKWIQYTGGIIPFYISLGLHYTDARTGARRAGVATSANKKSQSNDVDFSQKLIEKYGESNIHWQAPYNKGVSLHRSDFKVYKPDGSFFFIDLFFPQDIESLQGCVNIKLKKLARIPIEKNAKIYFVCCNNTDISPYTITQYISSRKTKLPLNIKLIHLREAGKYI